MKIIVGVDDSETGEQAVRRAVEYARRLEAELDVVFVSHVPPTVLAAMGGVPTISEDFVSAQRAAVWKRIEPLIEGTGARRVDLEGYPPDALVDLATAEHADLIVVGSRGRSEIASLFLGSTSHRVVNHAPCDVLIVRGEEG
ncbi:MAG TPA: universal stress protein [Acidimicrobiia bacterium]